MSEIRKQIKAAYANLNDEGVATALIQAEISYARIGNAEPVYRVALGGHVVLFPSVNSLAHAMPISKTKARKACKAAREGLTVAVELPSRPAAQSPTGDPERGS